VRAILEYQPAAAPADVPRGRPATAPTDSSVSLEELCNHRDNHGLTLERCALTLRAVLQLEQRQLPAAAKFIGQPLWGSIGYAE
jgi:TPP-dependent 2-oxoacid decarboxylase